MQGVIRRGTYNLKYAKGFLRANTQFQQPNTSIKNNNNNVTLSKALTTFYCSFFFLVFYSFFGLQSSASFLLSTPSYQTANVHVLVLVLRLAVVPVPVPVPIAHRWCCGCGCGHALSFSTLWTVDTTRKQVSKRYLLRSTTWCGCRFRLCLVNRKVWKHKRGKQFWIHTVP